MLLFQKVTNAWTKDSYAIMTNYSTQHNGVSTSLYASLYYVCSYSLFTCHLVKSKYGEALKSQSTLINLLPYIPI